MSMKGTRTKVLKPDARPSRDKIKAVVILNTIPVRLQLSKYPLCETPITPSPFLSPLCFSLAIPMKITINTPRGAKNKYMLPWVVRIFMPPRKRS